MSSKRDELILSSGRSFGSSNGESRNEISNHVVIRPCLVGVEIVFSILQTPLSSVLQVLREYGLCVLGCISSNVNGKLIHTVQAEVQYLLLTKFIAIKTFTVRITNIRFQTSHEILLGIRHVI